MISRITTSLFNLLNHGGHWLLLTAYGRTVLIAVPLAAAAAIFAAPPIAFHLGLGFVPVSLWLLGMVFMLNRAPRVLARHWRYALASLVVAAVVVGGIGVLQAPEGMVDDEIVNQSLSGTAGNAIARWPAEWDEDGGTRAQMITGGARTAGVAVLAGTLAAPGVAAAGGRIIGRGGYAVGYTMFKVAIAVYASIAVGASALFGKISGRREEPVWQPEMASGAGAGVAAGGPWAAHGDPDDSGDFSGRLFGSPYGHSSDEPGSGGRPTPPLAGRAGYSDYNNGEDDFDFERAPGADDRRETALPARAGEHYVEYGGHRFGADEDADDPYYPAEHTGENGGHDAVRHVTGEVERPEENGDGFYSGYGPRREGDPSERHGAGAEDGEMAAPLPYFMQIPRFPWPLPGINLLKTAPPGSVPQSEIDATSQLIVDTLAQHGIDVSIGEARVGPRVTMYGVVPGWGQGRSARGNNAAQDAAQRDGRGNGKRVRVDTILNREKDLALALASPSLRFEAPVPGASLVGIEVPNSQPSQVTLRTVMDTEAFRGFAKESPLPVPLGVGSGGEPVMMDLTRMPHVLVAGATGSGKSVCMNTIATSLLMTRKPSEVRMVMVDPKRVELTPYADVPHLATPPIVEAEDAVAILKAAVEEMMLRFKVLESAGARNITAYNQRAATKMPYLVIMVDELADLMVTSAHEVERLLCRLAQLGRATGIHLVVATQRPSVDVVTGLIKANFPSRISFNVMSQVDSRTILDSAGAEKLLGKGDMLYLPVDRAKALRVQGGFLSDTEIEAVVRFWKKTDGPQLPQLEPLEDAEGAGGYFEGGGNGDTLFDRAVDLAGQHKTLSVSLLQRRLRIGYPRAARLMDELTEEGIVGEGEPGKPRPVLIGSGS